jgi:hypothetical protein
VKRLLTLAPIALAALFLGALVLPWLAAPERPLPSFTPARPPQLGALQPPLGSASLSGRVVDIDGRAVSGVTLYLRSGNVPQWTETDERGEFEFLDVHDEDLAVAVLRWGHPPRLERTRPGTVEFVLPPASAPPAMVPDIESARLSGQILHPMGSTALDPQGYELVLRPTTPEHELGPAVERRVHCDTGASFAIDDLALSTYDVHVVPHWATGSLWPDLAAPEFARIEHRGAGFDARVILRAGAVAGYAVDAQGAPVEGVLVTLQVPGDPVRVWLPQLSDAAGRFYFADVPPGTYVLSALAGEGAPVDAAVNVEDSRAAEVNVGPIVVRKR